MFSNTSPVPCVPCGTFTLHTHTLWAGAKQKNWKSLLKCFKHTIFPGTVLSAGTEWGRVLSRKTCSVLLKLPHQHSWLGHCHSSAWGTVTYCPPQIWVIFIAFYIHLDKDSALLLIILLTSDVQIYVARAWASNLNFSSCQKRINIFQQLARRKDSLTNHYERKLLKLAPTMYQTSAVLIGFTLLSVETY